MSIMSVMSCLSAGACTKQGFLAAPEADPTVNAKVGSFNADTHFLLEPTGDAEALLGRAVHITSAGGWTIADERAPGCVVRVKRSLADYEKSYRIGLGDMTALSGGYGDLLRLEARYGRSVEAAMKIHNLETLTADIAGPCGDVIVKSVRVGTGDRTLQRKAEGALKARVGKGPIGIDAGREAATDSIDEMRWSNPQAYAFTYEQAPTRKIFELDADIPDSLIDGEKFELKLTATDDAYLVIYYLEENGQGDVLYPSAVLPVPRIEPGEILILPPRIDPDDPLVPPSRRPLELHAKLNDPNVPARETLVVYAFAARADFDRFRPAALDEGADTLAYAAKLTEVLSSIPISRWDRHTVTIEILPRAENTP